METPTPAPAAAAATTFLALPAEVKLDILQYLPAREIARARRICRALSALVESKSNSIVQQVITREYGRLQAFVHYHVAYKDSVTFLEAIARWGHHRGWSNDDGRNGSQDKQSMYVFADHWLNTRRPTPGPSMDNCIRLQEAAITTKWAHLRKHHALLQAGRYALMRDFVTSGVNFTANNLQTTLNMTDDEFCPVSNELMTVARLIGPFRPSGQSYEDGTPILLVTNLMIPKDRGDDMERGCFTDTSGLSRMVGNVPQLPRGQLHAYYVDVNSPWAYKLLRVALNEYKSLVGLKRAAVMEELKIY